MLAGLAAGLCAPRVLRAETAEPLSAILGRSRLAETSGFAVADVATGRILEGHAAGTPRQPASVAKILTALYALDRLGGDHRFRTSLRLDGTLEAGRLIGDAALVGGGDPTLDTDQLGDLALALRAAGIDEVAGRLRIGHGALPELAVTEESQPAHVGYNPAISGANLNFNRVWLAWKPGGSGPLLELRAPGSRHSAPVRVVRAELGPGIPLEHRMEGEAEIWRVAPRTIAGEGGVWLPVRRPAAYAGDVFRAIAERAGTRLPPPQGEGTEPPGREIAARESAPLGEILQAMLHHSTNLTAEVAGLAAARRDGRAETLAASGAAMTAWARDRYGIGEAEFVNHSGLTTRSRISPRDMVRVLVAADRQDLAPMLRERQVLDGRGNVATGLGARVVAKTGTLWFVRGLAGYLDAGGRRLAFAILAADLEARGPREPVEAPPGADGWVARARGQENALLRRWAAITL